MATTPIRFTESEEAKLEILKTFLEESTKSKVIKKVVNSFMSLENQNGKQKLEIQKLESELRSLKGSINKYFELKDNAKAIESDLRNL